MYIFDLDGTLTVIGERKKYIEQDPKDWESFFNECDQDKPNEPIVRIWNELERYCEVYIVTGRPERLRKKTKIWILNNDLFFTDRLFFPDRLLMRPDNDHRPDTIVKPELVKSFISDIDCVFEDRQEMVNKWRELGLCCVQVNDGK